GVGRAPTGLVRPRRSESASASVEENRERGGEGRIPRDGNEVGSTVTIEIARHDLLRAIVSTWEVARRTEPSASAVEQDGSAAAAHDGKIGPAVAVQVGDGHRRGLL